MDTFNKKTKLLVIGAHSLEYARNKVLLSALEECFEVNHVHARNSKYLHVDFLIKFLQHTWSADAAMVMWPGRKFFIPILFVKILTRKKLIIDLFNSDFETHVLDRKKVRKRSRKARYLLWSERLYARLADVVIFDTLEHCEYLVETLKIPEHTKKVVLPISVDLEEFTNPGERPEEFDSNKANIVFAGYFIPLQGIEHVVEAAFLQQSKKNVQFFIIGAGQTSAEISELAKRRGVKNIVFKPRVPYSEVIQYFSHADIVLGIFGLTEKADRVVPNKVLEGMASGTPVITGKNTSMQRYFTDRNNIYFCERGNPRSLSDSIEFLMQDNDKANRVALNAKDVIRKSFSKESLLRHIRHELTPAVTFNQK